eukprot:948595-Prymnesium_polylepis.1
MNDTFDLGSFCAACAVRACWSVLPRALRCWCEVNYTLDSPLRIQEFWLSPHSQPSWRDMGIFPSLRAESGIPVTDERSYGRRRS